LPKQSRMKYMVWSSSMLGFTKMPVSSAYSEIRHHVMLAQMGLKMPR
jgi:hypothetical protein